MTESILVGRDDELATLAGHLDRAIDGSAAICMVTGEPGAGKSSLLTSLVADSMERHPQLLVATGECNALGETGDPYLPFREILQDLTGENSDVATLTDKPASRFRSFFRHSAEMIAEHGPDLVDIFVPGAALAARIGGKAAKRLGLETGHSERGGIEPQAISQDNIFEQYVQVLRAIASERPLLLILDDLHWADSGTAGLLFHLARRLAGDPILLVGAFRSQEVRRGKPDGPHALSPIVAELQRIYGDIVVDLDEQNPVAFTDALLDATPNALDSAFRRELVSRTGGNPLFVVELLHSLEDSGVLARDGEGVLRTAGMVHWSAMPSRVEGVVQGRLQQMTDRQREILDIACVQGAEFSAELTARIVEVSRRKVIAELSGPLQRDFGIVTASAMERVGSRTEAVYRFRHNLFQNYLYEQLDEIERAALHEEIAEELETLYRGEEDVVAVSLAHHFARTPQWHKTLRYNVMAGDRARSALAPREALTFYHKALEIIGRHGGGVDGTLSECSIAERLGDQAELLGEHEHAIEAYERALATLVDGSDLHRATILARLAVPLQRLKQYDRVKSVLGEAEEFIEKSKQCTSRRGREAWLDVNLERAYMYYWTGDTEALERVNEAIAPVIVDWGTGVQKETFAASRLRLGLRQSRYRADASLISIAKQAIDDLDADATELSRMHAQFQYGFALMNHDAFDEAAEAFEAAIDSYQRCGDLVLNVRSIVYLSVVRRRLQQVEAVHQLLDEAESLVTQIGASDYDALLTAQRAWLAYRDMDMDRADRLSEQALEMWRRAAPGFPFKWPALWIQIAIRVDRGNHRSAMEHGRELIEPPQMRQPPELEEALQPLLVDSGNGVAWAAAVQKARAAGMI